MLYLEMLRKSLYEFDDHRHFLPAVKLSLRMQTVVACAAVLFVIFFSEIVEQQLSAT